MAEDEDFRDFGGQEGRPGGGSPAVPAANGALGHQVVEALLDTIHDAQGEVHLGERVAFSNTSVALYFTDAEGVVVTLLLDRDPLEAVGRELPEAETEIHASSEQWDAFWKGEYQLAMGIARGEVSYRGPVRKFLRAVPILRRLADDYRQLRSEQHEMAGAGTRAYEEETR
jgi:hypothetical protein